MTEKFNNKNRFKSARAQWWNYGWNGAYFVTICTDNRENYFGEIQNGKMILSETGIIAENLWYEIPNHSVFVELGEFVVMPNHVHGIIIIDKPEIENNNGVDTGHALHLPPPIFGDNNIGKNRFQNQGKNTVSSIIGGYKSAVTKNANLFNLKNGWQKRFHDHIIRDHIEFERISNYIIKNPENWEKDKFK